VLTIRLRDFAFVQLMSAHTSVRITVGCYFVASRTKVAEAPGAKIHRCLLSAGAARAVPQTIVRERGIA